MRNTFYEKKVLAQLFRMEMQDNDISIPLFAEKFLLPESMIIKVMMDDEATITAEAIFDLMQMLHHDMDLHSILKKRLYIRYEDYKTFREMLIAFYNTPHYDAVFKKRHGKIKQPVEVAES